VNTVRFLGEECNVEFGQYVNGRIAIDLICQTGERMARATVNDDMPSLADDEVAIKDYSENAGMLKALQAAGVVGEPLRYIASGFVQIPICRLLVRP